MNEVSIFSWNVLADCFAMDGKFSLDHVPSQDLLWSTRLQRILDVIQAEAPDVICLQEVTYSAFDGDFQPNFEAKGYECLMQRGRWKEGSVPFGNATFWLKSKFKLIWEQARSRIHTIVLEDGKNRQLALLNCHLEGEPTKIVARVTQLHNSLEMLNTKHSHHAEVIVGDFNCELRSSACASYLAFGSVLPGVLEWGREVPAVSLSHAYSLMSAYTSNKDDFSFTISGSRGFCGMLDQLWFSQPSLRLLRSRPMFSSPSQRASILAHGLPSSVNPSDHLPIGACFEWNTELKLLGPAPKNFLPSDLFAEAALLLENCPLTDEQRLEWIKVNPQQIVSKKPSSEEITVFKALAVRKQNLLNSVDEDAQQILKRVIALQKQASKQLSVSSESKTSTLSSVTSSALPVAGSEAP